MLRKISANYADFKAFTFRPGLNIVVADTTRDSRETDSRNSAGKSSLIELLHFLLGASADKGTLFTKPKLKSFTFALELDWPSLEQPISVARSGERPNIIEVSPLPRNTEYTQSVFGHEIKLLEWQRLIERDLFKLPAEHPGISGRVLLSFLVRRAGSGGFASPVRTHPRQSDAEGATNLAYLLGLDWGIANRYREIQARERMRRELKKAADDPILGKIVGSVSELRGQIAVAENRVNELRLQIDGFHVVPGYERLREEADALNRRIRELRNQEEIDRRNLEDLTRSVEESHEPDTDYVAPMYEELGVMLGDQVIRRFEEVQAFHESVVRNRRRYLSAEAERLTQLLREREQERTRLGEQLAEKLRSLREGGALDALTTMQRIYAQEESLLSALRHRFEAAQAVEASRREITLARASLQDEMDADLEDRSEVVNQAIVLFSNFARSLYGPEREAYLRIESGNSSLVVAPHIASDTSVGISSMVTFCFDLALTVIAHRAGRAPDFLVHDSHLFDGVDERQLARSLELARLVCDQEGIQYIVTLNSDDLEKAQRVGFKAEEAVLSPTLSDRFESGGLFGFRF
ncbi:ABC-three component system protein [Micromonospora palythoicola]|uniref:ABC-three component system protein n=1 Tax=Micromonospora palythoicola TaxID=3120507 RepID=UPI002FCE5750